jgi:hypothetical protein
MLPKELPGNLSQWTISTMPTHASLLASVVAEMNEYLVISAEENGGYSLYKQAVSIKSSDFAFLTVPPMHLGLECIVKIVHCTKEYILPMGQSAGTARNDVDQALLFLGERQLQQLPRLLMQPTKGLDQAVMDFQAYMLSSNAIAAFYASKDTEAAECFDLLPRHISASIMRGPLTKWIFILTVFVPGLIEGLLPRQFGSVCHMVVVRSLRFYGGPVLPAWRRAVPGPSEHKASSPSSGGLCT